MLVFLFINIASLDKLHDIETDQIVLCALKIDGNDLISPLDETELLLILFLHVGCTIFDYHIPKFVVLIHEGKEQTTSSIFHDSANQSKVKVEWILNENEETNIWYTLYSTFICHQSDKLETYLFRVIFVYI